MRTWAKWYISDVSDTFWRRFVTNHILASFHSILGLIFVFKLLLSFPLSLRGSFHQQGLRQMPIHIPFSANPDFIPSAVTAEILHGDIVGKVIYVIQLCIGICCRRRRVGWGRRWGRRGLNEGQLCIGISCQRRHVGWGRRWGRRGLNEGQRP